MLNKINYLGIDPGKTGAFVILNPEGVILERESMPVTGTEYNIHGISDFLLIHREGIKMACIEMINTVFIGGKASNFDFGYGYGILRGLLVAHSIPHLVTKPRDWQNHYFRGMAKGLSTKEKALEIARNQWPSTDFRVIGKRGNYTTKIDDGFVDALLLANFARFIK